MGVGNEFCGGTVLVELRLGYNKCEYFCDGYAA